MSIEIKMPALSPTMEEGTLAKWLVKEGDAVKSGDIMAEIETDKATMEFEAVDEGTIAKILVAEGTDNVAVGAVIAILAEDGEDANDIESPAKSETPEPAAKESEAKPDPADPNKTGAEAKPAERTQAQAEDHGKPSAPAPRSDGARIKASPLARRIAAEQGLDLGSVSGSGPNGRIVKADVEGATPAVATPGRDTAPVAAAPAPAKPASVPDIPHEATKLSNIRKTIARRLTESKQNVPHIYLTVDVQLDKLLKLRGDLNAGLEARGVKLSVNDLLVKALAVALIEVPKCNVMFTPDQLISFSRADISVAVSTPTGLITPVVTGADTKSLSAISDRGEGACRPGAGQQAEARAISGRHRLDQQHGHVRDQAVRRGHQPPAGHDPGSRRGREAALCRRRRAGRRDGDERDGQFRSPGDRRGGRRRTDARVQDARRKPAGDAGLIRCG